MRNRSLLSVMEHLIMVLVFALAAALCMQVFVIANRMSRQSALEDRAVLEVQNVAETLKTCQGDYKLASEMMDGTWDGQTWVLNYDADWNPTAGSAYCRISVRPLDTEYAALGGAELTAYDADSKEITQLSVAWQEVASYG